MERNDILLNTLARANDALYWYYTARNALRGYESNPSSYTLKSVLIHLKYLHPGFTKPSYILHEALKKLGLKPVSYKSFDDPLFDVRDVYGNVFRISVIAC